MNRKKRRLMWVGTLLLCSSAAVGLSLWAMSDGIVFFVTPSELAAKGLRGHQVRLGGMVEAGTVQHAEDRSGTIRFSVTDGKAAETVTYRGTLPDLFREGQGVVVVGVEQPDGVFKATEVLAKHDEKYMPKEVADQLKASGEWQRMNGAPAAQEVARDTKPPMKGSGS
jgi:cytochrome c-type biogenesis protein CcmE